MKVKIGNTYYDSAEEPIMLVLAEEEKRDVMSMVGTVYTKICKAPIGYLDEGFKEFMDLSLEEESRFTEKIK